MNPLETLLRPVLGAQAGKHGLQLYDADFISIENIALRDVDRGLWVHSGSTDLTVDGLTVHNALDDGLHITEGLPNGVLTNLDLVLRHATGLPVSIADDPLSCVALGTGRALEEMKTLRNVLINTW